MDNHDEGSRRPPHTRQRHTEVQRHWRYRWAQARAALDCGGNDDVHVHLEKLADLGERLSSYGRTINDAEYISVILGSLPPRYDAAVDSLTNLYEASDKDLTSTAVIRMATNEQEKRQLRKGKSKFQDNTVFLADEREREAEERKNKRKNVECHNCHKKGH